MKRGRDEHLCNFKPVQTKLETFICVECRIVHACGREQCDSLTYNSDHTHVCMITGMCFEQRMCETFIDPARAFIDDDPVYIKKTKRDQQIKNKVLDRGHALKIIRCAAEIVDLNTKQNEKLCSNVLELWSDFVVHISDKKQYVHRKDKRCFVVAIAMSLVNGIKNNIGVFVVKPHENIKRVKLNKKSKYEEFDVSDIRYGQNLIKKVFRGVTINPRAAVCIH